MTFRKLLVGVCLATVSLGFLPGSAHAEERGPKVARIQLAGGACVGDALEPDAYFQGPTRILSVGYGATQTCTGSFVLQRTCVRLQEYDFGRNEWYARTTWSCGRWTSASFSRDDGGQKCSDLKRGKFRTQGRGEVETRAGTVLKKLGTSSEVWHC